MTQKTRPVSLAYRTRIGMVLAMILLVVLAACGGGTATSTTPTPTLSIAQITDAVMQATQATKSFHFAIAFEGKSAFADPDGMFQIVDIEGDLIRPDAALVAIRVRSVGSIAVVRLVSLDGQIYVSNPITRQWRCLPPGAVFDPVVLFDPDQGIDYLIREHFEHTALETVENLDEHTTPHYHIQGIINDPTFYERSYRMLGAGDVNMDVWADTTTHLVSKMILEDTASDPDDPTRWIITLSQYNEDFDIHAPIDCPEAS
jgi:lipoprotein LprG